MEHVPSGMTRPQAHDRVLLGSESRCFEASVGNVTQPRVLCRRKPFLVFRSFAPRLPPDSLNGIPAATCPFISGHPALDFAFMRLAIPEGIRKLTLRVLI